VGCRHGGTALEGLEVRAKSPDMTGLGIPLMARVPDFAVRDRSGQQLDFASLIGRTSIVLLLEARCGPCRAIIAEFDRDRAQLDMPVIALINDAVESRDIAPEALPTFFYDGRTALDAFMTAATPFAAVLGPGSIVLERTIPGSINDLRTLALNQRNGEVVASKIS
jgi:hypothetical protein